MEKSGIGSPLCGDQIGKQGFGVAAKRAFQSKCVIDLVRIAIGEVPLDPIEVAGECREINRRRQRPQLVSDPDAGCPA